jgi:hypothetical protein
MDGAGAFAEGAGIAAGEHGLHLGEDGEGDLFGGIGAEVEADGSVEAGDLGRGGGKIVAREVG